MLCCRLLLLSLSHRHSPSPRATHGTAARGSGKRHSRTGEVVGIGEQKGWGILEVSEWGLGESGK